MNIDFYKQVLDEIKAPEDVPISFVDCVESDFEGKSESEKWEELAKKMRYYLKIGNLLSLKNRMTEVMVIISIYIISTHKDEEGGAQ